MKLCDAARCPASRSAARKAANSGRLQPCASRS